jgi:HK97 gp10 family phage protein
MSVTSNAGEVAKDFTKVFEAVSGELERAITAACIQVSADAKKNQQPHIDLGNLNKSIEYEVEEEGKTLVGTVGTNSEYAVFHEFGTGIYASNGQGRKDGWVYTNRKGETVFTRGSRPYPFLTPALESNRSLINRLLAAAVKEGTT